MSDQLYLPFSAGDEQLRSFKYLGSTLSEDSDIDKDSPENAAQKQETTKVTVYQAACVTTLH